MQEKKLISIVTPCYNEEENVEELNRQITEIMAGFPQYDFEHIFIDNASTDQTVPLLRKMAARDKRVKVIINTRNFGSIRSPHHALLQSKGLAVITIMCDFQDPPLLIKDFLNNWEKGYKIVIGVKSRSQESGLMYSIRKLYYSTLSRLADIKLIENFTGFGLYDRQVVETLRKIDDPYPYFRGLIADIGYETTKIEFIQPKRKHGKTKHTFYSLFDTAMLGFTNNTKIPLRLATMLGFLISAVSFLIGLAYLIYKLENWQGFQLGLAPLVVGIFFLGGIQLLFLGILGEYIGAIYTQVLHRPLVIEKERINFD